MGETQRNYVVTAAAGGIGGALVHRLLAGGGKVFACDISGRRLQALADALPDASDRLKVLKVDVGNPDATDAVVQAATEFCGRIDGLANIAGGIVGFGEDLIDRSIERTTVEELEQSYRLNVQTSFVMTQAFVPIFEAQNYGKVANVASLAAFGNFDMMGNPAYDAAKSAVIGMSRTLSRSLGPRGIRVNVVAPGSVYTEKVREAVSQEFIDMQLARTPLRAMPGPDDVAAALEFLLLPGSDMISGEVLRVSGGLR